MATTSKIEIKDGNPVQGVRDFLARLLNDDEIGAVLTMAHLPTGGMPMPTLMTSVEELDAADPLAPAYPMNGARMVARLTHGHSGEKVAAIMRPCEIRAFIELVKMNQGSMDEVILIGLDCAGAYDNRDYGNYLGQDDPIQSTLGFWGKKGGSKETARNGYDVSTACLSCERPSPEVADLTIGLIGVDLTDFLPVMANTPKGEGLLNRMGLPETTEHKERIQALQELVEKRIEYRDRMFEETSVATSNLEGLGHYLSGCVNCYNCRNACPVCYCKECVFSTDVFEHKPWQYLGWAKKKGMLKMPTDTMFFHLTRLAHMSTSCVGCGQCSNACPNDINVMELFRTVGARTQEGFGYQPGRSVDEPLPLSVFQENEFPEVVASD